MKYYEMHEMVYQQYREKGFVTWDGLKKHSEILDHHLSKIIDKNLSDFIPQINGKMALELGAGTGPCTLWLAKKGFDSYGYDISETAIEMAKENSIVLDIPAKFEVKDVTEIKEEKKFDLIVDGSLLHCIVHFEDRNDIFKYVRNHLSAGGYFFIHTMIESEDMSQMIKPEYFTFKNEVLWSTGPDKWDMEWHEIDGRKMFAHRRVRSKKNLELELRDAGFSIISNEVKINEKSASSYIAWLQPSN